MSTIKKIVYGILGFFILCIIGAATVFIFAVSSIKTPEEKEDENVDKVVVHNKTVKKGSWNESFTIDEDSWTEISVGVGEKFALDAEKDKESFKWKACMTCEPKDPSKFGDTGKTLGFWVISTQGQQKVTVTKWRK